MSPLTAATWTEQLYVIQQFKHKFKAASVFHTTLGSVQHHSVNEACQSRPRSHCLVKKKHDGELVGGGRRGGEKGWRGEETEERRVKKGRKRKRTLKTDRNR